MGALNIQAKEIGYANKCIICGEFVAFHDVHCGHDTVSGYFDDDGVEYSVYEYGQFLASKEFYANYAGKQVEYNKGDV